MELTGPVSTWWGITVSNGRVLRVELPNNNLNGTIPESIGNLSALIALYLYLNNLTGGIPSTLGNISTLQLLLMHDNPLGGEIPASLGNLTSLNWLYIYRCNLTGQIPATLGNLSNLLRIAIHQNDLTGNLEWIGSLTNLTQLWAHGLPNLQCEISPSIGNLTQLTHLVLHNNPKLIGSIPTSIGNLTKLIHLYLYNNPKLTGTIPSSLGSCIALQSCYLHNNGLSGELPGSLANLTNLTNFWVHFNYSITGNVPSWISGLTKMQILSLGYTDLGGSLPSDIGNLSVMTELYIQRCRISGNLPSSLQSAVNLSVVGLNYLNLTALPSFLTSFTKMKLASATANQLTEILDFTTHVNKANLVYNVENNKLDFGDLEPHFTGPGAHPYNTFTYSPQADIGTAQTVYSTTGSADTLQVTTPGSLNIYQWQKKDGTDTWQDLSGQTASQLHFSNVSASDSGQYRLKITNQHATALTLYSLPFTVKVTGEVLPPDAEGQRICANQTATLTATGTGIISWFDVPAGGTSLGEGSPFVTPVLQANKTYYVSQDVGGTVSDRRDVLVEVDSLPSVTASPDASICSGASTTISVSGNAVSYQWNNGLGQEQSYPVSPAATTTYTVTGTGANGCQASDDVVISVNPLPDASISPSAIEICSGASATLTASGGVLYQWAHGPSGSIIEERPDATTTYTVTVTDSNGCVDAAQSTVTVNTQCPAAPEEFRAAALLTDQIKLTWVNKATNYTGLNLERKTTGSYELLTSLEAGNTSYVDSTLQPGTLYYYRIKSFNPANESIPSNEENEKTFSTDQHYVRNTEVLKDNVTDPSAVPTLAVEERIHSWNYLDGELRPFQQVIQQYSPSQKDAVQPHAYDPLGRTVFQFLPYTISSSAPGELREDALATEQPQFYDGTSTPDGVPQEVVNPFTEVKYEPSPLSRVIESSATGNDWRMAAGQTIKMQYGTNVEDEVLYWTIVEDPSLSLQAPYYYAAGQLSKVTRTDMEGSVTVTYTDKLGRTVLQKSSANAWATVWASTYSIFDQNGNLAYHITPKVVEQTTGGGWPKVVDAAMLNGLCMQYKYDNRNRIIEGKAPGVEPVYYVYDKWNRLVLSQDGNQRLANKWAFSKYDEWNRVVMTGITVNADTVTQIRSDYDNYTQRFESRSDATGNIHGYTNLAQPISSTEILTVSYYDDYSSLTTQITSSQYSYKSTALTGLPSNESARTLGLVTASKVKVLETANDYLNTVSYFDDEQRTIQIVAGNHLGGVDRSSILYNFPGWVTKSNLVHFEGDTTRETTITRRFDYDHTGRLLRTWHQLDSANEILLSDLTYNELGQLIRKELNKEGTEKLQAVDYRHTIQGWLQGINTSPPATGDPVDYYAQEMAYNNTFNSGSLPRLDGYITATKWKNDIGNKDRLYNFEYDALGRLAGSTYMVNGGSGWSVDNGLFSENNLTYDINGNIQTLDRYTKTDSDGKMDQLTYTYGAKSNQLLSVVDSATSADSFKGFSDGNTSGNDYQYDANGNLKQDLNKEISAISYNALDLPGRIDFADSTYIQYTYDAAGVKLSQSYYGNDTLKIDYIGEFIYLNGQLQLIHTEEGRLLPPEYKNLFANKEANSLEGFDPLENVSLATESINGQNYVRAISNQSTGTPGVWPVGGTIPVKPGEKYSFKVLGYQRHGTTASLYVWGSNGEIIWLGPVLPIGSANEDLVTAYFTVPAGVSQVKLGVRWNNPAVGDTLYINRVALYKTDWEYQYFISDHLGSPRVVLQTNPATHTYTSTMESENLASEEFENIETDNIVPFVSANTTPGGNEVLRMNNSYRLGAARSLKVYPGDVVDASVFAYYEQDAGYSKSPNSTIIALLTSALTGGGIATTGEMVTGAYESTGNSLFALAPDQGSSKPSAFLNYILFDENFVPVEGKSAPVGDIPMTKQLISVPTIMVKEVGYLYVYLSYDDESANWVFFDDLKIQHRESAVVQVNAFYPYGLTAYTWVREGEYENRFLFQGKELDSLTNWHDFHARQYDAAVGRWFANDPQGEKMPNLSNYAAMMNNPVMYTDPDGECPICIPIIVGAIIGGTINAVINGDNIQNPGDFFKYFGVGALAGGLAGAGGFMIAPGATAALGTGFLGGAAIGGAAGAVNGLVIGAGNTWLGGGSFGEGFVNGLIGAGAGALIGGVTGGAFGGIKSAIQGRNFWTGASKPLTPLASVQGNTSPDLSKVRLIDDPEIQLQAPKGDLGGGSVPKVTATELPGNVKINSGDFLDSKIVNTTSRQLQAKFKHAADFGIEGNYNKVNSANFNSAINQHLNSPGTQVIHGTYRGEAVIHYLNPATRVNVMTTPSGQFISGWRLGLDQLKNVLQHGGLR